MERDYPNWGFSGELDPMASLEAQFGRRFEADLVY